MMISQAIRKPATRRKPVRLDDPEKQRIEQLRHEAAHLAGVDGLPLASAAEEWLGFRRRLRQLLANEDPRRFIEWDCIGQTMHVGANAPYTPRELSELQHSPEWSSRWRPVLREDAAGCPVRCQCRPSSSGNLIHHAYHLFRAEPVLGKQVQQFSRIIEFGGGYGSFCRLAFRLGFRGRYVIFDFPEFSALQRYFLRSVGVPLAEPGQPNGAHCISQLDDLAAEARDCELFVGLWSISETPLDFRRRVLASVAGAGNFLLASQAQFGEADNIAFFKQWAAANSHLQWSELPTAQMTADFYLIGTAGNAELELRNVAV